MLDTLGEIVRKPIDLSFHRDSKHIYREVRAGAIKHQTSIAEPKYVGLDQPALDRVWASSVLRGNEVLSQGGKGDCIRSIDLFSGAGGFTSGLASSCTALGLRHKSLAAIDLDNTALSVFRKNHNPERLLSDNIDMLVDYELNQRELPIRMAFPPEVVSEELQGLVGKVDIVLGGPPCQGYSNFNNHTRRADPRSALYLTVPALAIALEAPLIVIENVQSILNDRFAPVKKARQVLECAGYHVDEMILQADRYGVAQTRRRHFLVASRFDEVSLADVASEVEVQGMSVDEAICDLTEKIGKTPYDTSAMLSEENVARVSYLFEQGLYELPNQERPDCHKDGHTYPSVYGRLRPELPAQTLTGGFLSPGRGRYIHPTEPRGLTPHEGARLQGFPDNFKFVHQSGEDLTRKEYAKLIGDAVPPPLGFVPCLAALASRGV